MVHEDGTIRWVLEQAYPDRRRGRRTVADPGRDLRHHRAQERRGAGRVPRVPRQAHRAAEPSAVRGDARDGDRARATPRPRRRRALPRPRQLQARERLARPPRRRRAARSSSRERLRGCTRETDLVARQGGDEFLLLLADLERGMGPVAGTDAGCSWPSRSPTRVHEALQEPFDLGGVEFFASASIGDQPVPAGRRTTPTTLAEERRRRDVPVEEGRARWLHRLRERRRTTRSQRLSLTTRLRRAVEQKHWVLHWQPVVELADGTVAGRRSADPVARAQRRDRPAGGVHPAGRGARADRGDRRLGDRRGRAPAEGVGGRGDRRRASGSTCRRASSGRAAWRRR